MRRLVLVLLAAAACGGVQVPQHNGYKANAKQPWKKPKVLKLDDKGEAKDDGNLSYPDMRRAKWYAIDTPSYGHARGQGRHPRRRATTSTRTSTSGSRSLRPRLRRTLFLADAESQEDAHELTKKHTTVDLAPGRYLVHLYLEVAARHRRLQRCMWRSSRPPRPSRRATSRRRCRVLPPRSCPRWSRSTTTGAVDGGLQAGRRRRSRSPHVRGGNPPPHQPPPPPKDTTPACTPETLIGPHRRHLGRRDRRDADHHRPVDEHRGRREPKMHGKLKGGSPPFDVSSATTRRAPIVTAAVVPATVDQVKSAGDSVVLTP